MAVTPVDIKQLETFADRMFGKVGIDVEFTHHFLQRANDERNDKEIMPAELTRLFKQEYKRWGKPIAQLGPDAEGVMQDTVTNINVPFALVWDSENQELDLIAKTVMRKDDFKTADPVFAIEDSPWAIAKRYMMPKVYGGSYKQAAARLHRMLAAQGDKLKHDPLYYAMQIARTFEKMDTRALFQFYKDQYGDEAITEAPIVEAKEIEFVCVNPSHSNATIQDNQDKLYELLKQVPGIVVYRQDFGEHNSMAAILKSTATAGTTAKITALAKQADVEVDLNQEVSDQFVDSIYTGTLENLVDFYDTDTVKEQNIFQELDESRMWKQIKQLNGLKMSKIGEYAFEQLLALQILAQSDPVYAAYQAAQIMKLQNFDGFRVSQPDLYNVLCILLKPEQFDDRIEQDVKIVMPELRLKRNLRAIAKGNFNNSDYSYMMLMLQREMQDYLPAPLIQLRRQASTWDRIVPSDRNTISDRLMLQMREKGFQNEYYERLRKTNFSKTG